MGMKALNNTPRLIYLGFFASHIVFTLIVDSQAVLPQDWIPSSLRKLLSWYITRFNDPLFQAPQPGASSLVWFQALVGCELLFQLPFFVVACRYLSSSSVATYPDWFRCACIAYGSHTVTSLVAILATLTTSHPHTTAQQRTILVLLYLPYLVLPLGIFVLAVLSPSGAPSSLPVGHSQEAKSK